MTEKIKKGVYEHFQGRQYLVLGEVTHSETREVLVLYIPLYGKFKMFVRPKTMFFDEVDRELDKPKEHYRGPRFRYAGEP